MSAVTVCQQQRMRKQKLVRICFSTELAFIQAFFDFGNMMELLANAAHTLSPHGASLPRFNASGGQRQI